MPPLPKEMPGSGLRPPSKSLTVVGYGIRLVSSTRRTQKHVLPLQVEAGRVHPTRDAVLVVLLAPGG
jgi:hypothetical protein